MTSVGPALEKPQTFLPIVTPEGVSLAFTLAHPGDRLIAFLLDGLLIVGACLLLVILWGLSSVGFNLPGQLLGALVLLLVFLLTNFYFIWFETRGRGMTPGKRRMNIRVMDAEGGVLSGGAVAVRNVMRNLEFTLPLVALFAPRSLWPSAPGWAALLASLWLLILAGMPLFNRRHLRVGDLVAGTVVVLAPRARLLADLGSRESRAAGPEPERFAFTTAQVDAYGAFELQVLEDLLRRKARAAGQREALRKVADRIAARIEWGQGRAPREARAFLLAYYAALRARLEQKMLFGKRKKDKFHLDG